MCPNQDSNGHQRMLLLSQGVVPLGHNDTATEDNLTFPTASIIFYNLLSDIRDIERSFTRYQIDRNYLVYNNYWESWLFPRVRIKKIFVDRLAIPIYWKEILDSVKNGVHYKHTCPTTYARTYMQTRTCTYGSFEGAGSSTNLGKRAQRINGGSKIRKLANFVQIFSLFFFDILSDITYLE